MTMARKTYAASAGGLNACVEAELANARACLEYWTAKVSELTAVRDFLAPLDPAMLLEDVFGKATAGLAEAEEDLAGKQRTRDEAREHLRDLQGYQRVLEEHITALEADVTAQDDTEAVTQSP
jgi:hypothetical protein